MKALFTKHSLRVLMYHKVDSEKTDMLTVTTTQLDEHLLYLKKSGYQIISANHLLNTSSIPQRAVLLTFDDAYLNNLEHAYPILKKHQVKATIFVPTGYVGTGSHWDILPAPLMTLQQLQALDPDVFELALHTHSHAHVGKLNANELAYDLEQNISYFKQNGLAYVPVLAYPYGARPIDSNLYGSMLQTFQSLGIKMAFRIGNRINAWPLPKPFEVERLDIRGTDSFDAFKRKIRWGKVL